MLRTNALRFCSVSQLAHSLSSSSIQAAAINSVAPACAAMGRDWKMARNFGDEAGAEQRELANPRVLHIAEQIMELNLLEVSDLTEILRKRLNIQAPAFGMPFGAGMLSAGAPAEAAGGLGLENLTATAVRSTGRAHHRCLCAGGSPPAAAVVEEKTEFTVKLAGFDAAAKIKVIKEVRGIPDLGLKEAKDLVSETLSRLTPARVCLATCCTP